MSGKTIHLYNNWHLGDGVFMMNYLFQIRKFLQDNDITIVYHCKGMYKTQLAEFAPPGVHIESLETAPPPVGAVDTWMRYSFATCPLYPFNDFLQLHSNRLANILGLPKISSFFYKDADLLTRYKELHFVAKSVDVLFINAVPQSFQYNYVKSEWDQLAHDLVAAGYKVITTSIIHGIECTLKYRYSIKDIAAISTHAKYIVAVNSGPVAGCLNEYTMAAVKKWFVFDKDVSYKYPTIQMCSRLDEVYEELLKGAP